MMFEVLCENSVVGSSRGGSSGSTLQRLCTASICQEASEEGRGNNQRDLGDEEGEEGRGGGGERGGGEREGGSKIFLLGVDLW